MKRPFTPNGDLAMTATTSKRLKPVGIVLLALPILILAVFAIGEVAGGDISGLQHIIQLVPLLLLAWLAWRWPVWGGIVLTATSLIVVTLVILFLPGLATGPFTLFRAILFLPPLVAGVLFILAGRAEWPADRRNGNAPPTHA
jgi:hypothetical protein